MIGTIQYVNEKEGKRGKYLTLALEDGTKGLVVNDEKIMEAVNEGETYDFTLEKSGIFTIVTGIIPASEKTDTYSEDVKTAERLQKSTPEEQKAVWPDKEKTKGTRQKPAKKPQAGTHHSEYMKKKTPEETEIIAKQAFAKSLIEAYARLWVKDSVLFKSLSDFNEQIRRDADGYVDWLEIEEK